MNAHNSRAMAVTTLLRFFPLAMSLRKRPQSLTWAFQAMLRTSCGKPSSRPTRLRLSRAGWLYVWAASVSTRRTWPLPVLVMPPRLVVEPLECSLGTSPRYAINCFGESNRVRSRMASSSAEGTWIAVNYPERCRRARFTASRRSFLIRWPLLRGISDGAATTQSKPCLDRKR